MTPTRFRCTTLSTLMALFIPAVGLLQVSVRTLDAQAPARRALAIEDYYRFKSLSAPRISPDGQWVVYGVSSRIEDSNGTTVESWAVRTDGVTPARRIQHEGQDVTNSSWVDRSTLRYRAGQASWT